MKKPMLFSAIAGSAVAVTAFYFRQLTLFIGVGIIVLIFVLLSRRARGTTIFSLVAVLLILTGTMRVYKQIDATDKLSTMNVSADFTVIEPPVNKGSYCTAVARVSNGDILPNGSRLLLTYGDEALEAGDCFHATVTLKSLQHSEYKASSYSEKIYASGKIKEFNRSTATDSVLSAAQNVRNYIKKVLLANLPRPEAATLAAVTMGDKSLIAGDFSDCIRRSGVSHVMVVSGMHLAIIMGGLFALLEKILYHKYLKALISIAAVLFMTAVCGFTMSIIRAGITFVLAACAIALNRDNDPVNTLGATVTAVLIVSPFAVFSISFQLSVLATFGILVLSPFLMSLIYRRFPIENSIFGTLAITVVSSLCATVMTLPVVIYCFGYISIVSPLTNMLITYAVTAALLLTAVGLVINLIPLISLLAKPVFFVAGLFTKYINFVIGYLGGLKGATMNVDPQMVMVAISAIFIMLIIRQACNRCDYLLKLKELS